MKQTFKCDGYPNCDCSGTCADAVKYGHPHEDVLENLYEFCAINELKLMYKLCVVGEDGLCQGVVLAEIVGDDAPDKGRVFVRQWVDHSDPNVEIKIFLRDLQQYFKYGQRHNSQTEKL